MEQRAVIHFFYLKKYKSERITKELQEVYGNNAYKQSTVKYWIHQFAIGRIDLNDAPRSGRPNDFSLSSLIQKLLDKDPYLSARQLAKMLNSNHHTIIHCLMDDLGLVWKHLRWVPHFLTKEIKKLRVERSKVLLSKLKECREENFSGILTGDESWFVFCYEPTHRWMLQNEKPEDIVQSTNYQKKVMVSIYISPDGQYLIDILPTGQKFNSQYFCDSILPKLESFAFPDGREKHSRKWLLHFDNAPVHKSKLTTESIDNSNFELLPNPPYSPDLAPLDFAIFGTIKEKMPYAQYLDEEDLLSQIKKILNEFEEGFFARVFEAWEHRLEECIKRKGDYVF